MDPVHESGPWTLSKVGVHGPLVHVLSSPRFQRFADTFNQPLMPQSAKLFCLDKGNKHFLYSDKKEYTDSI